VRVQKVKERPILKEKPRIYPDGELVMPEPPKSMKVKRKKIPGNLESGKIKEKPSIKPTWVSGLDK